MPRKPPEPFRVIKEKKRLVLHKTAGPFWGFDDTPLKEHITLQKWLEYFENDEDHTWEIEYVTLKFIIMVRKKWEETTLKEYKKKLDEL